LAELQRQGLRFWTDDGVPKDTAKALTLFRAAPAKNYPPAQGMLGLIYLQGLGVKADPVESLCK
jgi:TPR repeat protein